MVECNFLILVNVMYLGPFWYLLTWVPFLTVFVPLSGGLRLTKDFGREVLPFNYPFVKLFSGSWWRLLTLSHYSQYLGVDVMREWRLGSVQCLGETQTLCLYHLICSSLFTLLFLSIHFSTIFDIGPKFTYTRVLSGDPRKTQKTSTNEDRLSPNVYLVQSRS